MCIFARKNSTIMDIKELLNQTDHFAANAGCRIVEVDDQHAVAEMTVTSMHLNGGHVCQGGALFTLADLAIAALMNQHGELTFGISNNIMFVATTQGLLVGDISSKDEKKIVFKLHKKEYNSFLL